MTRVPDLASRGIAGSAGGNGERGAFAAAIAESMASHVELAARWLQRLHDLLAVPVAAVFPSASSARSHSRSRPADRRRYCVGMPKRLLPTPRSSGRRRNLASCVTPGGVGASGRARVSVPRRGSGAFVSGRAAANLEVPTHPMRRRGRSAISVGLLMQTTVDTFVRCMPIRRRGRHPSRGVQSNDHARIASAARHHPLSRRSRSPRRHVA